MSKYDAMSDFDINLRVACAIDEVPVGDDGKPEFAVDCFLSVNNSRAVKWTPGIDGDEATYFNPCNDPSDAYPIIFSNSIATFETLVGEPIWVATTNLDKSWLGYGSDGFDYYHKNPLRAAMVVFLMMREAAND